jgi:hypothetical protein
MATDQIIALLVAERDRLSRAIEALQGIAKRGRPPKNAFASGPVAVRTGRSGMSAAARKAQSKRMKAYWAARRKKQAAK